MLRDFLISTLFGSGSRITYLHFHAKDILPIQNLIENMLWTLIHRKPNTNAINQVTMGLIFMNLSVFADSMLKKYTGHTFKELLQQQKLQQAAWLLSHTTLSVNAIMEAIGYNNSSFFYRVFRNRYGSSPKEYRAFNTLL